MNSIFCKTSSSFSSTSAGKTKHIVSSEKTTIEDFEKGTDDWKLPKIQKDQNYKTNKFSLFKTGYKIKTEEREITLSNPFETVHLFSSNSLKNHLNKGYKYIHIGLVQVGLKPLTRIGLNNSFLAILRDARFEIFEDSLLGTVESSLHKGLVSFDCYPNFTVSLSDKNILKSLILQIKTHNYAMIEGSIPIALTFKVHYKVHVQPESPDEKPKNNQ